MLEASGMDVEFVGGRGLWVRERGRLRRGSVVAVEGWGVRDGSYGEGAGVLGFDARGSSGGKPPRPGRLDVMNWAVDA